MLLQNLQVFNFSDRNDDICFELAGAIERSRIQPSGNLCEVKIFFKSMGYNLVKKIPQICPEEFVVNSPHARKTTKDFRDMFVFSNGKNYIGWAKAPAPIRGTYIIHNTCDEKNTSVDYAKMIHKFRNTLPKPKKQTVKNVLDVFVEFLNNNYINETTKEEIIENVSPFIATYKKRENMNINMNLSLIFCGKPGDGKTFIATKIMEWCKSHLGLPIVMGEAVTFQQAAKQAANFVAVIDDMNIAHFQRNGTHAAFCADILSEMDRPSCNRLFFLTTNETITKENVDKAFFRPGRVQDIIVFNRPDESVKTKFADHLAAVRSAYSLDCLDNNFLMGVKHFLLDSEYSLAEMFRLKNLIISDCVVYESLKGVSHYFEKCRKVEVPSHVETNYLED